MAENSARATRLITKREVIQRVRMSFPTIWKLMRQGRFPAARVIGGKTFWIETEIDVYIDTLPFRRYKR